MHNGYEFINFNETVFPLIFHIDSVISSVNTVPPHWHEALEILYCTAGEGEVLIDSECIRFSVGDTVVVNSECLHSIRSIDNGYVKYCCLLLGEAFFENYFGLSLSEAYYKPIIPNSGHHDIFKHLACEFSENKPYCKQACIALSLNLLTDIARNHAGVPHTAGTANDSKKNLTKKALQFIKQNFAKPLTIDEIAAQTGFSRYYFCHAFKEMTGISVISYINLIRCRNAKALIHKKENTICEIALMCGFDNFSYFTKTYKKYMGKLPSREIKTSDK